MQSDARTVSQYLKSLPAERRTAIQAVRQVILDNIPDGFEEVMTYGMIGYVIPLSRYPVTYNKRPLAVASLANQKNYMSLYVMNVYGDAKRERWLAHRFELAGKKLDMGKSCIRFRKLDDLPLSVVASIVALDTPERFIAKYEKARGLSSAPARKRTAPVKRR